MERRYRGQKVYKTIRCFNFEDLEKAIEEGTWFANGDFSFYYKSVPCEQRVPMPSNIAFLRMSCVTSKTTQYSYFFNLKKVDEEFCKVYAGEELNKLICLRMKSWARNMNPKTLRAFGGRSFVSYLNAIPREIMLQDGFVKRINDSLAEGFVTRICAEGASPELEGLIVASKTALNEAVAKNKRNQNLLDEKSKKAMEDAIQRTNDIFSK